LGFLGILDFFLVPVVPFASSSVSATSKASNISVHFVELQK